MKTKLNTKAALDALKMINKVVSAKTTLPVLTCVHLDASDGKVVMSGTDLDGWLSVDVEAEVETAGAVCVGARRLADALARCGAEDVEMELRKGVLVIDAGERSVELCVLDAAEFPGMQSVPGEPVRVMGAVLANAVGRVLPMVSDDATRYTINGVLFEPEEGKLRVVATDGRRLATVRTPLALEVPELPVIVPAAACRALCALDAGEWLDVTVASEAVRFAGEGWQLRWKVIEGNYPKWRQVVPMKGKVTATLQREPLMEAVAFAAVAMDKAHQAAKLTLSGKVLTVESSLPDVGATKAPMPVKFTGAEVVIGVSGCFLRDLLAFASAPTVTLDVTDAVSPVVLREDDAVSVLMPMRVG